LLKSAPTSTNLSAVVAVVVPDNTGKLGDGIGNVSLDITSCASPVLTVIFGYAIFLFLRVKNLVYFL
jgi:hypothetical protein